MDHVFLLKAAVCALIPVGIAIGVCFFILARCSFRSIRGKDVEIKIERVRLVILILFTFFVGIFAVIAYALKG
jgi:hypothetical protein